MTGTAAVTGATGFVGQHVVAALAASGWRLRLLVRRDPRLHIGPDRVDLVPGGLGDHAALDSLVSGADVVIHVAGAVRARGAADFDRVNRDGTEALARAMVRHAPRAPLVMVSSLAARAPETSAYAASKAAGEAAAQAILPGGRVCVLRPAAVYGPGDAATLGLFRAATGPIQPVLNGAEARVALIHVRDVAAAVAAMAARPAPGVFTLSDARREGYSWPEITAAACAAAERRPRAVRVPAWALRLAGRFGDAAAAVLPVPPMLTSGKAAEILHPDWAVAEERTLPGGAWAPRIELDEGFAETLAWYRDNGWLRARVSGR